MKSLRTKLIFTAIALIMLLVAVFAISTTAAPSYTTVTFVHGDEVYERTFESGSSLTLPNQDEVASKIGGTVYGWFDKEGNFYNFGDTFAPKKNTTLYVADGGEITLSGSFPLSLSKGYTYIKLNSSISLYDTVNLNNGVLYVDLNGNDITMTTDEDAFKGVDSGIILANSASEKSTLSHTANSEESFCLHSLLSISALKKAENLTLVVSNNVSVNENMNLISVQNDISSLDKALNVDIYGEVSCKRILRSAGVSNGDITLHDGYMINSDSLTITKGTDGNWYFKNPGLREPALLQGTSGKTDALGLGGTYNFQKTFSLVFTPSAVDPSSGILTVNDPITPKNGGTFKYTITSGGKYVFEDKNISVERNTYGNWFFKNSSLGEKVFFASPSAVPNDTTVLSGSFNINLDYVVQVTPNAQGSIGGKVAVLDPAFPQYCGSFDYETTFGAKIKVTGQYLFEDLGTSKNVLTFTVNGGEVDFSKCTWCAIDYSRYKMHIYSGIFNKISDDEVDNSLQPTDPSSFFPDGNYKFIKEGRAYKFAGCNHSGTLVENAPDCTSDVTLRHICKFCDTLYDKRYAEGVGHSFAPSLSEEIVNTPEETKPGCYTLSCTRCDATENQYTFPDPATVYVSVGYMWKGEEVYKRVPALDLFSVEGTEVKSFSTDALTHDVYDKDGNIKSSTSVPQTDVFYVEIPLGAKTIFGAYRNGTPSGVFLRNNHLQVIEIPVSVVDIQQYAFSTMPNLKTVIGLENVSGTIGEYAFKQNSDSSFFVDHMVINAATVGNYAFQNARMITLTFTKNVTRVNTGAFSITEGVESLLSEVFVEGCPLDGTTVQAAFQYLRKSHYGGHQYDGQNLVFLEHAYSTETIPSTCLEYGYDILTCSRCDISVKSNFATEYAGHSYEPYHKDATCQTYGVDGQKCTVCNYINVQNNLVKNPNNHVYTAGEVKFVVAGGKSFCVDPYYTLGKCACGAIEADIAANRSAIITPPAGSDHAWLEKVLIAPNCGTYGQSERTCTECGEYQKVSAPPVGKHTMVKIPDASNPPTCVKGESGVWRCDVCGQETPYSETTSTNPNNHTKIDGDKGEVTREPTETAQGQRKFTCRDCGVIFYEAIDKLPPSPTEPELEHKLFGFIEVNYWFVPLLTGILSVFGLYLGPVFFYGGIILLYVIIVVLILVILGGGILAIVFTFTSKKNKAKKYKFKFNKKSIVKEETGLSLEEQLAALELIEQIPPDVTVKADGTLDEKEAWTAYMDAINTNEDATKELENIEDEPTKDNNQDDGEAWTAYVDALNQEFEETREISLNESDSFSMDDMLQDTIIDLDAPSLQELEEAEELARQEASATEAEAAKAKKPRKSKKSTKTETVSDEIADDETFNLGDIEPLFSEEEGVLRPLDEDEK